MLAAAGCDGAGLEQAVRAAMAAVTVMVVRRKTRMGRIVTSLPRRPLSATYSLSAPRLRPATVTVSRAPASGQAHTSNACPSSLAIGQVLPALGVPVGAG